MLSQMQLFTLRLNQVMIGLLLSLIGAVIALTVAFVLIGLVVMAVVGIFNGIAIVLEALLAPVHAADLRMRAAVKAALARQWQRLQGRARTAWEARSGRG